MPSSLWGVLLNTATGESHANEDVSWLKLTAETESRNTEKILEPRESFDAFRFHTFVGAARGKVLILLSTATWPIDHQAVDLVAHSQTESQRQLGLREIARSAFYQAGLGHVAQKDPHPGSNRVTI